MRRKFVEIAVLLGSCMTLLWSILAFGASGDNHSVSSTRIETDIEPLQSAITAANVGQIELLQTLGRGSADVLQWSPDGAILAIGGSQGIWLYDRQNWAAEPRLLADERGWVREIVFNVDGQLMLTVDADRNIALWDVEQGEIIDRFGLGGDQYGIGAMEFTPSGRVVVATSNGRYVALRDFHTGYPIWIRRGNAGNVRRLRFTANGQYLISEGESPDTVIWDVESATSIARYEAQRGVLISQDGQLFERRVSGLTGNRPIFYTAMDGTFRQITPLVGGDGFVVMDRRMQHVIYWDRFGDTLVLVDVQSEQELMRLSTDEFVAETVQFGGDGRWLGAARTDGTIQVWEMRTAAVSELIGHEKAVRNMAFSPDGQVLVSVSDDGSLRIWSMAAMGEVARFPYTMALTTVAISPDSERLYVGGGTGEFSLDASQFNQIWGWDVASGEVEMVTQHHQDRITSLLFHPDGTRLAIGSLNGVIEMVLPDGLIPITVRDTFTIVNDMAFHPTDQELAVAGMGVEIWRLNEDDQDVQTLTTSTQVSSLAYSHDGKLIAASHGDLVTVWEREKTHIL